MDNIEKVILADVLYEEHDYPALAKAPLINEWFQTTENLLARQISSTNAIAGDKIAVYAPYTVAGRHSRTTLPGYNFLLKHLLFVV